MATYPYKKEWDFDNCPDIKQTKADNIARRLAGEDEVPVYEPIAYSDPNILFRRLPRFLEENEGDRILALAVVGEKRLKARFDWASVVRKEISNLFSEVNVSRGTWDVLSGDSISREERFVMCQNAVDLMDVSYNARSAMLAGLYLDGNKLVALCDKPAKEAARIINYNLFLANVAMIYVMAQENEDKKSAMDAPKIRKLFLDTLKNPRLVLETPKMKDPDGTEILPKEFLHRDIVDGKRPKRWNYDPVLKLCQNTFDKAQTNTKFFRIF